MTLMLVLAAVSAGFLTVSTEQELRFYIDSLPDQLPDVRITSNPDGWMVPDGEYKMHWVSRNEVEVGPKFWLPEPDVVVKYFLYTKSNWRYPVELFLNNANVLYRSNFNSGYPTRFIIHGFRSDLNSDVNTVIRDALMKSGTYNVICVDWSSVASSIDYIAVKNTVPSIGRKVARFLDFLNANGRMRFDTLTLIGHSLGAHVCGFAGKHVRNGRVGVIVGLDVAFPLYSYSNCAERLCKTDASFVESIHTNGGVLGFLEPIGNAAFYPNGGQSQPGCILDLLGICSHLRSFLYYAEALVRNNFRSIKCSSYQDAVNQRCGRSYGNVRMGTAASTRSGGIYYVPVHSQPPYGKG